MCGFGSNQSAPTSQFSTQTTTADPRAAAMYNQSWQNAQKVAQRPFTPYSNDPNAFVAPMNSVQLSAVNDIYGMQNAGQPYYQAAPGMAYASGNTSAAGLAPSYMSPYLNSVAAATMGILGQQQGQQQNQLSGDIAKNGQWGNSRSGVERALLSGQQNLATANTISNLYNTGYNSALGAAQTDLDRQLKAAQGLGQAGQAGATNLLGAGTVGQQTQQKGLEALYNQFMMQQQYPFQVAQFLSSTAAGLGPGYGGTTSGYQSSQQPLSFFGNPLSDPSLKVGAEGEKPEVIGQTNDGQDIYRYRVINPDTGEVGPVQIGLMADEVQQRRPDAIGDYKGFKTVDYAKATDGAARMGGGVMGRGDYADGGSIDDILRAHEGMYAGLGKQPTGIVPQSQMQTARLDAPTLRFADAPQRQNYGLGQAAQDALGLIEGGKGLYKEGSGLWDALEKSNLVSGVFPSHYASGGTVYDDTPDMTQGPEVGQMPVAHLDAPQLSFGSDGQKQQSGGLGDLIKGAAGLAGAAKTIFDIGSTVGPALMALSDRRLKTGVDGYAEGGSAPSDEDTDYVARTMIREAGGEGEQGMRAVADVIRNRLNAGRYGASAKEIVLAPKQFSPWNEDARGTNADPRTVNPESPLYQKAVGLAREELGGTNDLTGGATHFYNPKLANPKWAAGKEGLDIGNHRFLSADAGARPVVPEGRALALAPKDERPSNAGLDAMPAQAPARGGLAPAGEDLSPAQGISGMIRGTPASGLGEKALDFATSERFLVPLLTGLGTMASSGSRYLAPAVLQGLGAGAQAYMQVPKVQSEIMKNTLGLAATRFKPLESGNFYDNVLGRVVSPQERMSSMQGMFNGTIGGGGSSASTPSAPQSASGSVEPAVKKATDVAKEVAAPVPAATPVPATGPAAESASVLEKAMTNPNVASLMQKADDYEREANGLLDKPFVEGASERANQLRGLAANYRQLAIQMRDKIAEPELAALRAQQEAEVRNKNELVETQKVPGAPSEFVPKADVVSGKVPATAHQPPAIAKKQEALGEYISQQPTLALARQQTKSNLEALAHVLETYEPGRYAEQKAALEGALKAAGFDVDLGPTADTAKFEQVVKNSMAAVMNQAASSGDERLKSAFETVLKANPGPGLQPEANRAIIGKALGLLNWEDQHYNDLVDWAHKNPYAVDRSVFERDWIKNNPTSKYIKEATASVSVRGAPMPPMEDRISGKTRWINPHGHPMIWNGSQWQPEKGAR